MKPTVLIDPVVRWAALPSDTGKIKYIDGVNDGKVPMQNELITRLFLVDPMTGQPIPVRVVEIQEHLHAIPHMLVVVVALPQ